MVASPSWKIAESELEFSAIRASGPGGQNVNKVSTAIALRFDIQNSSLPDHIRQRLLAMKDSRITKAGVLVIKAQRYRSQELNRNDALERLHALVESASQSLPPRIPTRRSRASVLRRLTTKKVTSARKKLRGKVSSEAD